MKPVYKCEVCGNVVELLFPGGGQLVCCGKPMLLQTANTVDASLEKHVPVVELVNDGIKVKIGSDAHPMIPEHYIEWIELYLCGDKVVKHYLKPGDKPEVVFKCNSDFCDNISNVRARCYCNIHGLWKNIP